VTAIKIGVQLLPQYTSFAEYRRAWLRLDELGVDSLWTWDHFFPLFHRRFGRVLRRFGQPDGPSFEGWTALAALGPQTRRAQVGCLVLSMGYRNPALLSAMATTLDHATGGRLILGLGAGWFERDYTEFGYRFGTAAERLATLERGLEVIKARWQTDNPRPLRGRVPIMVGGGGEKVTLRIAARHADLWNGFGPPEAWARKSRILDDWCAKLGRDPAAIERTVMIGERDLARPEAFVRAGATHLIYGLGVPFNPAPVERLLAWRARRGGEPP
jgi:probable F420-dependent oxidoreductase